MKNLQIDTILDFIESRKVDVCFYNRQSSHSGLAFRINRDLFIACDVPKTTGNIWFNKTNDLGKVFKFEWNIRENITFEYTFEQNLAQLTVSDKNKNKIFDLFKSFNEIEMTLNDKTLISSTLIQAMFTNVNSPSNICNNRSESNNSITFCLENILEEFEYIRDDLRKLNKKKSNISIIKFEEHLKSFLKRISNTRKITDHRSQRSKSI